MQHGAAICCINKEWTRCGDLAVDASMFTEVMRVIRCLLMVAIGGKHSGFLVRGHGMPGWSHRILTGVDSKMDHRGLFCAQFIRGQCDFAPTTCDGASVHFQSIERWLI